MGASVEGAGAPGWEPQGGNGRAILSGGKSFFCIWEWVRGDFMQRDSLGVMLQGQKHKYDVLEAEGAGSSNIGLWKELMGTGARVGPAE